MSVAKSIILKAPFDSDLPGPEHFEISSADISPLEGEGSIQVQLIGISPDPFLRMRMKTTGDTKAGSVISGFVVGKVILSNGNEKWTVGDLFGAMLPFTTIQNVTADAIGKTLMWKLTDLIDESDISLGLGILGMPGSTAYGGLIDVLRPKEGEIVFVSAASGAVGGLVGQLAKNVFGCKVIGSCGGPKKVQLIKEKFGYDEAIDYKTTTDKAALKAALKAVAPEGIDMYFENVGGMHFEVSFESLRQGGRIAVCGGISEYNNAEMNLIKFNPMAMVYGLQRIEGFISVPWLSGARGNFLKEMHGWWREGKLKVQETRFDGIEAWPEAFQSLFTGKNLGKVILML